FLTSPSTPCRWGFFISTRPLAHRVSGSHMWSAGPRDPTWRCSNSQRLPLSLSMCELCCFLSQDVLLQKAPTASCMAGETLK
ncbi:hypothetical protein M9458_009078, partial [Cirrhinus mrigala]